MEEHKHVQSKNLASKNRLEDTFTYISSSEDEEELDEKHILELLYKNYQPVSDASRTPTSRTSVFLENTLHSGAATCLICIGGIKRVESIWSCQTCYCFFHLNCIQRWANDSVMQMKVKGEQQRNDNQGYYNHLGEFVPPKRKKSLHWCCPQCRMEYQPDERPTTYNCFCGKEINPPAQPFLVPHSCGEVCGKFLEPKCGHDCKLLCHPGPCPPCAQQSQNTCRCGKSAPRPLRCIDRDWQCQEKCEKLLSCGKHKCNQRCHRAGNCPGCTKQSTQPCECGRDMKIVSCANRKWKCQNICGGRFVCGLHSCDKLCHKGPCEMGECPFNVRSCPCGKNSQSLSCSEVVDTCGDTCQKILSCGQHTCTQRCHRGPCNSCLVTTRKKCRCGLHEKELPCSKEFTCDTKCKQVRDCGKHACNRKCCGDQCLPCEKICGKPLSCNKHKCQSVCHRGPCYPCRLESVVNCRCGKTRRSVPCGRERNTRNLCLELCRVSAKCHHIVEHRCHKGECPPCRQRCGLLNDVSGCGHICKAVCHEAVKVKNQKTLNIKTQIKKTYEYKSLPHPRCEESVNVKCIGGHEVVTTYCWNSKPTSCYRKCGRILKCGNHQCNLTCHTVANLENMQQQVGCINCEEGCVKPRPSGCSHPCPKGCHLPPCSPCTVLIKSKCHCGLIQVMYKCSEFFNETGSIQEQLEQKERLGSCGNRCIKNFPCGHRCLAVCHSGICPGPELCRKKVRIYCPCKRLKQEIACDIHRAGQLLLQCNSQCEADHSRAFKELALKQHLEDEKNRMELEKFQQKFGKRKHKERKIADIGPSQKNFNWQRGAIYAVSLTATLGALAVAYYADRMKWYIIVAKMNVTGRRKLLRLHKVYIFLIRINSRVNLAKLKYVFALLVYGIPKSAGRPTSFLL
ncbi:NF-X1-type zinc finger protein NFXL1 isoform X2 [Drosophila tropicalis]|uniref:NF-X1-type zinc finger protein NFXL1 isoform X2 n=1 Tax=Drosophila tropicalis TaxID=46794 RepID=UPI0035AB8B1C